MESKPYRGRWLTAGNVNQTHSDTTEIERPTAADHLLHVLEAPSTGNLEGHKDTCFCVYMILSVAELDSQSREPSTLHLKETALDPNSMKTKWNTM